jgi:hypothetical protein
VHLLAANDLDDQYNLMIFGDCSSRRFETCCEPNWRGPAARELVTAGCRRPVRQLRD